MQITKLWDVCVFVARCGAIKDGVCVGNVDSNLQPTEYVRVLGVVGAHHWMVRAAKEAGAPFDEADLLRRLKNARVKIARDTPQIVFYPKTPDGEWIMMVWIKRVE